MSQYSKRLVITFDAFGTLFHPRESIGKSYAEVARKHGLSGFSNNQIDSSFRDAFKQEAKRAPNYGKQVGMGASQWWTNVIQSTFQPFVTTQALPKQLVPDLLARFNSSRGYNLNTHAAEMFQFLLGKKRAWEEGLVGLKISVGVITNSDDRVPVILSSLGLKIGSRRHGMYPPTQDSNSGEDVNFVVMSYDVGYEKPALEIFNAAADLACVSPAHGDWCLHIGDDLDKDLKAAEAAGWDGILLCHGQPADYIESLKAKGIPYITDLLELKDHVTGESAQAHRQARQVLRERRWR